MTATDPAGSTVPSDVPSSPLDDPHRLAVLAGIDFDDPELRRQLDVIAARTAERLDAPVCLVTLLSHITQFFPGAHGLPPWLREAGGTPVEWSFCTEVVASGAAYTVTDLAAHPAHAANPLVTVDGARSYAGVPLILDGVVLGAHCVVGVAEHAYTDDELDELRRGARDVTAVLDRFRR